MEQIEIITWHARTLCTKGSCLLAIGVMLASRAGAGASWMVRLNVQAMKDWELVDVLSSRLGYTLDGMTVGNQRVTTRVGERS